MRGLSLWQPWASLVAAGLKRIETRGWRTDYRGELAIQAAQVIPSKIRIHYAAREKMREELRAFEPTMIGRANFSLDLLPRGFVLAVATLESCVATQLIDPGDEREFGDYAPDRWAWILTDIRPLAPPYLLRGHQGLWNVEERDREQILARAGAAR